VQDRRRQRIPQLAPPDAADLVGGSKYDIVLCLLPQNCACHQVGIGYTDTMWPIETIEAFDLFLHDRGLRFDGVVIGGAALSLLGIVFR
jgi:hypothetical protein